MATVSLLEYLLDVPVVNITGVCLFNADLQLVAEMVLHHSMKFFAGDEHIDSLRAVVFDFDGMALSIHNCLSLFIGEFRKHIHRIPHREKVDDRIPREICETAVSSSRSLKSMPRDARETSAGPCGSVRRPATTGLSPDLKFCAYARQKATRWGELLNDRARFSDSTEWNSRPQRGPLP